MPEMLPSFFNRIEVTSERAELDFRRALICLEQRGCNLSRGTNPTRVRADVPEILGFGLDHWIPDKLKNAESFFRGRLELLLRKGANGAEIHLDWHYWTRAQVVLHAIVAALWIVGAPSSSEKGSWFRWFLGLALSQAIPAVLYVAQLAHLHDDLANAIGVSSNRARARENR